MSGCRWPNGGGLLDPAALSGNGRDNAQLLPDAAPEGSAGAADAAGDRAVLGRRDWIVAVAADEGEGTASPAARRWRHPGLEDLLGRPPDRYPDFRAALSDPDAAVATNAALALARCGDPSGTERLAAAIRSPELPLPMRCAAAEALGEIRTADVLGSLRELIDQYGQYGPAASAPYVAELHAELLRGLARHVDPSEDPRFTAALRSPSADVRLAAVRAWTAGRGNARSIPVEVLDQRAHGDYRVRAATMELLGRRRPPEAEKYLEAGLGDLDARVRLVAVAGLGELGGPEAEAKLEALLADRADRVRAEAVVALAKLQAAEAVLEAAEDDSWRVRREVAKALARFPGRRAAAVAGRLLDDPSAEVQTTVIAALADWPIERAGPILLRALGKNEFVSRTAAAGQLAGRWPPAVAFPPDGPPERRAEVLARLQSQFGREFGLVDPAALGQTDAERSGPAVSSGEVDRVARLVAGEDRAGLLGIGPRLLPALERLVFDRQRPLPEWVYRDVLPLVSPSFEAIARLSGGEAIERRRAAAQLAALAADQPLGPLAVDRLGQVVAAEPDQLVWQSVFKVIAGDATEPAVRLACAAVGHPAPEVRRLACAYLAEHPEPRHAKVLEPALSDPHPAVVCEAIRAIGATGALEDAAPLRAKLADTSEEIRLETALALSRLGDPAAVAALERLAYSDDPTVRRRAAEEMGRLGDPSFVPTLIRLLDDRLSVCRAALESLPKLVGHDVAEAGGSPPRNTTERIARWKQWHQRR